MASTPFNNSNHKRYFLSCWIPLHCFCNIIRSITAFKIHIGDGLKALLKSGHIQNIAGCQSYFCSQVFGRKNLISFKRSPAVSILFAFHNDIRQLYHVFLRIGFGIYIPNNIFNVCIDITTFTVELLYSCLIFCEQIFLKDSLYEKFCRFGKEDSFQSLFSYSNVTFKRDGRNNRLLPFCNSKFKDNTALRTIGYTWTHNSRCITFFYIVIFDGLFVGILFYLIVDITFFQQYLG